MVYYCKGLLGKSTFTSVPLFLPFQLNLVVKAVRSKEVEKCALQLYLAWVALPSFLRAAKSRFGSSDAKDISSQ